MGYTGKKVVGVWIDHQNAFIISTPDRMHHGEFSIIHKLAASHHADHSSNEQAHNHKVTAERHKLFEKVSHLIDADDSIFVTGPGTAQEEFSHYLKQQHPFLKKEIAIGTSDHPTENQKIAEVRNHFKL